jgi:transcriptional regulator with XRE-family HTH domain
MTGDDLRTAARALNLSGRALARELGINERTYRRYLDGSLPIPRTVELAVAGLRSERDGLAAD